MCQSCLQCWVSDQGWRIRAYVLELHPFGNGLEVEWQHILAEHSGGGGHGLDTSSPAWGRTTAEDNKHENHWVSILRHCRNVESELDKRWRKHSSAMDRIFGFQSGYSRACAESVAEAHIQEQRSRSESPWAQEVVPVESSIERCPGSHAARNSRSQSCAGSCHLTGKRGSFGTIPLGISAI